MGAAARGYPLFTIQTQMATWALRLRLRLRLRLLEGAPPASQLQHAHLRVIVSLAQPPALETCVERPESVVVPACVLDVSIRAAMRGGGG